MFPFIETICIESGMIQRLNYHQERVNRTFAHFWPKSTPADLSAVLTDIPTGMERIKARIEYQEQGVLTRSYTPYTVRNIHTLQLVYNDTITYTYKSSHRTALIQLATKKNEADEVIIVKQGLLTDTSYSNIALYDGKQWFTPSTPLLNGTMRQWLIDQELLIPIPIRPDDLHRYQHVALINAMMPLGDCVVEIDNILR